MNVKAALQRTVGLAVVYFIITPHSLFAGNHKPLTHHCPAKPVDGQLVVDVLAVGQGDSTFIRTPNGTTLLIDGGNPGRGSSDVLPTLRKCFGLKSLDYVVLSHPHSDHLGGLIDVLKEVPVNKAVFDTGDSDGAVFAKYASLANQTKKRKTPELGENAIKSGDGVQFKIVAVNGHILGGKSVHVFDSHGKPLDKNSLSIAMVVTYGEFRYFTGGDLSGGGNGTPDVETPVADVVGKVDLMKSDHHGSATANNPYFMQKLHPRHILISVGDGESNKRYHLPNAETMTRLTKMPFVEQIFQTARGEGRAPATETSKVNNAYSDILITVSTEKYSINGHDFSFTAK